MSSANRMSNLYENIGTLDRDRGTLVRIYGRFWLAKFFILGQSRNGIAPAKPQRAASIRERTRQIVSVTSVEESFVSTYNILS